MLRLVTPILALATLVSAETPRKVYISATDAKGAAIADLKATDLTVKEGGKPYPVASLTAATAPMQVAIVVDAPAAAFQNAVAKFLEATLGKGQFMITMLTPQPRKVVDFTDDVAALKDALGQLGGSKMAQAQADQGDMLVEAVDTSAKALQQRKLERSIIVVFSSHGGQLTRTEPEQSLSQLRASGASLNVIYRLGLDLGPVLVDGMKQMGGLSEEVPQVGQTDNFAPAATRLADKLLHQYVLTYALPDGVKMSDKVEIQTSRKDIKLIAPSRIPNK
jgi:VWFA-related protein